VTVPEPRNLRLLYLMEVFAGLARGAYLVCIGWTTLVVTGDVARVGQVFVVAMLTIMLAGPVVGVIADRYDRRRVTIVAYLLIAAVLAVFGMALATAADLALVWFFVAVFLITGFRLLYQFAHDGLIHANVASDDLVHVIARFRSLHLFATTVGTVATGVIIERFSPSAGFLFAAAMSLLLILPVLFVQGGVRREKPAGFSGFVTDFLGGLRIFRSNQAVRSAAILAAVALPVGQLANAVLSSLIRDDLGLGSDVFGLVDGAWPLGGMLAALVLSLGLRRLSTRHMEYAFGVLVGVSTVALSMTSSVIGLVVIHAVMGFSVWLCRIVIDGRVLQSVASENVGRAKTYVEVMFSVSALIMVLSPTLVRLPQTSDYFLYWGLFIVIATVLLRVAR